jgi:alpha-N-arabinofuranosidase
MHTYYEERKNDRDSFLASAVDMDNFIDAVVATADHVRAKGRHKKRINIAFDEWNVWYQSRFVGEENLEYEQAPRLIEDCYNVVDAVVVGTCLNSLLRHADRVKIGCLAQLVNVIAPIMTEPGGPAWRQTIFHPFALASHYGRGTVLRIEVDSPVHDTAWQGEVPVVDATAVQRDDDEVVLFLVNRDQTTPATVDVDLRAIPSLAVAHHTAIFDEDPEAVNTMEEPDRVVPRTLPDLKVDGGRLSVELAPLSWNMVRVAAS